jgi:hypothetical protein
MSRLDPVHERITSFLFPCCQARLDGEDLVVAVQRASLRAGNGPTLQWSDAAPWTRDVIIDCEPGTHRRVDRAEYPPQPAYVEAVHFRFRGGVTYGRVPQREGWALLVQGVVRSLGGLPPGEAFLVDEVEVPVHAAAAVGVGANQGPINGPHLPFP